jgi:hypothetical protein
MSQHHKKVNIRLTYAAIASTIHNLIGKHQTQTHKKLWRKKMTNQPDNKSMSEEELMKLVTEMLNEVFGTEEEGDPDWTVDKETRDAVFPEEAENDRKE